MSLMLEPGLDRNLVMAAQLGVDTETYRALQALQTREISPEDYELLGRLDENIKPSTLDGKRLQIFPTETFRAPAAPEEPGAAPAGVQEACGVCLVDFQDGDELRMLLPCRHRFHRDCIDYWLLERATTCPVDNMDVSEAVSTAATTGIQSSNGDSVTASSDPTLPERTARGGQRGPPTGDTAKAAAARLGPHVDCLMAMGFDAGLASEALARTGGDLELAAHLLLEVGGLD